MKFFHFEASTNYLESFRSLSLDETSDSWLHVKLTSAWFDICTSKGREMIVRHLPALAQWAHKETEQDEDGVMGED